MSNIMLESLLKQANEAIEKNLEQARLVAWKDNVFENKNSTSANEESKEQVTTPC